MLQAGKQLQSGRIGCAVAQGPIRTCLDDLLTDHTISEEGRNCAGYQRGPARREGGDERWVESSGLGAVPIPGLRPSVSLSLSLPGSTPVDSTPPRLVVAWATQGRAAPDVGGRRGEAVSPGAMRHAMSSLLITRRFVLPLMCETMALGNKRETAGYLTGRAGLRVWVWMGPMPFDAPA